MPTGHNRFSVVEELSSPACCKIAAPVSPKRGYPELPELSENPLPSYVFENLRDYFKEYQSTIAYYRVF
jgi:hypothetical protein